MAGTSQDEAERTVAEPEAPFANRLKHKGNKCVSYFMGFVL